MIARVVVRQGATFDPTDPVFQRTYRDVLGLDRIVRTARPKSASTMKNRKLADVCKHVETALAVNPVRYIDTFRTKQGSPDMKYKFPGRGLQEIRTMSGRISDADNPQRKYLTLAMLALEKARRSKEKQSANQLARPTSTSGWPRSPPNRRSFLPPPKRSWKPPLRPGGGAELEI